MDIKTLLYCLALINFLMAVFTLVIKKTQKTFSGINFWVLSNFFIAGGYLFMVFRGAISPIFTILLAHGLFVGSGFLRIFGLNEFFEIKENRWLVRIAIISIILYLAVIWFFTYVHENIFVRTVTMGIVFSALSIASAIVILKNKPPQNNRPYVFISIVFFTFSFIFLARVFGWVLFPSVRGLFVSHFINSMQFFSNMVIDISWASLFFVIHNQKFTNILKVQALEQKVLNENKNLFFSIIAHDLRNPIASIMSLGSILEEECDNHKCKDSKKYLKAINDISKNTFELLEELLTWAMSQDGKIPFDPQKVNFNDIARDVTESMKAGASKKNIDIELKTSDIQVFCDANMISTVLRNLLSNAIKFTHPGGHVIVESKHVGGNFQFSVIDNGTGIDEAGLADLWCLSRKFSTLGTEKERGTGLGLILCKEFVEKHGGKIWAESSIGHGSSFTVAL